MKRLLALMMTLCMLCTSALATDVPTSALSAFDFLSIVVQSLLRETSFDGKGNYQPGGGTLTLDTPWLDQDFSLSWGEYNDQLSLGIHGENHTDYVITTGDGLIHVVEQDGSATGMAATWADIAAWVMENLANEMSSNADFGMSDVDPAAMTEQISAIISYLQGIEIPLQYHLTNIFTTLANELTANGALYASVTEGSGSAFSMTLHLDPALFAEAIFDAMLMESGSITNLFNLFCPLFELEAPTEQQVRALIERLLKYDFRSTMLDLKNLDTITLNLTANINSKTSETVWTLTGSIFGLYLNVVSDGTNFSGTLTGDGINGIKIEGFLSTYDDVVFSLNLMPMNGYDTGVSFTFAETDNGFTANFQAERMQASASYDYRTGFTASATGGTSYRFALQTDRYLMPESMSVKTRHVDFVYRLTNDRLYLGFKTFDTRKENYDFFLDLRPASGLHSALTANGRPAFDLLISNGMDEDVILTLGDVTFRLFDATPEDADPLTNLYALEGKGDNTTLTFYLRTTLASAQAPTAFTAELLMETMPLATVTFTPGVYNYEHIEGTVEPAEVTAEALFMSFLETPAATAAPEASENDLSEAPAADHLHYVQMDIEGYGSILLELDSDAAPITVENFLKLVDEGFYNGLTFHRIISGFMMQGGDPKGNGTGGSTEKIKGEFSANGVENPISHARGVISMARSSAYDSASSQFFIMHAHGFHLDGQYAAFGRVVSGMDVVDAICTSVPVLNSNGAVAPSSQPVITQIIRVEAP